jgi:hypothetical protein
MRLRGTAHTSRPWRIHEIAAGFRLEDVWELPTPGGRDDFPRLVRLIAAGGLSDNPSAAVRALWAIRRKAGELFGWDRRDNSKKRAEPTLRDRLPPDLRSGPAGPEHATLPFTPLYLTSDEWAAELVNDTVHGVMHIGWVGDATGGYRGQMAVLVRPNGQLGAAYMAFIKPLRHLIVYPALTRQIAQAWRRGRP